MAIWAFFVSWVTFLKGYLAYTRAVCASANSNPIFLNTKTIWQRESSAKVRQVILLDPTKYKNPFSPKPRIIKMTQQKTIPVCVTELSQGVKQ